MFHFKSICCCLGDAEEELEDCVSETEEEEVVVIASHHVAMATGFGEWEEHTKVSCCLPSREWWSSRVHNVYLFLRVCRGLAPSLWLKWDT